MHSKLQPIEAYLKTITTRVDLNLLGKLLHETNFTYEDVKSLCSFNDNHYQRNLISHSDWYDMLLLCWKPGQESAIHDHEGSSCAFRIVKGVCTEDQYNLTNVADDGRKIVAPVRTLHYQPGQICMAQDEAIHKISNRSEIDNLVTLHIYSPPLHMNYYETKEGDCGYRPPEASAMSAAR